jgi:hypothetical protein
MRIRGRRPAVGASRAATSSLASISLNLRSTSLAMWSAAHYGRATCTAPMARFSVGVLSTAGSPFTRGDGDLPLPKPVRSAMLASKLAQSGECRLRGEDPYEGRVVKLVENADGGHLRWSGYGLKRPDQTIAR